MRSTEARQPRPHARAAARAGAPSYPPRREGAALDSGEAQAARRDRRAARDARHRLQPERAGRRAVLHHGAGRRGRSRRAARLCARRRQGRRRRAQHAGKHVITLQRSSVEPFLQFSSRRDLREKAFRAWIARGDTGGKTDNKAMIAETIALRIERAKLLGYPTFAHYRLDDAMAKTPEAVRNLLETVWKPARVARSPTATRCRTSSARRAATSSSPPGTGATTPRSSASAAATSRSPRSSRTSSSTASSRPRSSARRDCSG